MTPTFVFRVLPLGPFLATRSKARQGRHQLETGIADAQASSLTIDFSGVEAMTISFADEFLGKLATTLDAALGHDVLVKVSGLNEETREAVDICLERRDSAIAAVEPEGLTLLGNAFLSESFLVARELGTFKATEFAERLHITPQNANNRLRKLQAFGAVQRRRSAGGEHAGKEFLYAVVADDDPMSADSVPDPLPAAVGGR